jgi:hypothetical protein
MDQALIACPNCGATMNEGEHCPECDHMDDIDCTCQICSLGQVDGY